MRASWLLPRLSCRDIRLHGQYVRTRSAMLEGGILMELLELMKYRRSIRKYTDRQVSKEDLQKIIEAGVYAPNAGGGQRSIIVAVHNKEPDEAHLPF